MKTDRRCQLMFAGLIASLIAIGCGEATDKTATVARDTAPASADDSVGPALPTAESTEQGVLNRPNTLAFSYGGFRGKTRDKVPTVVQLKEDLKILAAMNVNLLRTYNTQQFAHAANLLEAIEQLKQEDSDFEMFVMLGAWIDCEGAWTDQPNHAAESTENNSAEIAAAVELANKYPSTVKIIAVGNEAMVHWATTYFVSADVILKWVNHLQGLKQSGDLPQDVRITSSDNFASWGGESADYHTESLTNLINAVDYISLHTYPFHDTHYNSDFWTVPAGESNLPAKEQASRAVDRAMARAVQQYQQVAAYVKSLGISKPIHIGETGWASSDNTLYGADGSGAADEYKSKLFYDAMRRWTQANNISCFYFEAFDEAWKDSENDGGSENHFGLFTSDGRAKYALWGLVDSQAFAGLTRDGQPITKTFDGNEIALEKSLLPIPVANAGDTSLLIATVNENRSLGEPVTEPNYIIFNKEMLPTPDNGMTFPSSPLKLNVWEGTCGMAFAEGNVIAVTTGTEAWWGCGLEIQGAGKGEDLSAFSNGKLHFEIKGNTTSKFTTGFQTGVWADGTQSNNFVTFGPTEDYQLTAEWKSWSIAISDLNQDANLKDVTAVFYLRGDTDLDGKQIEVRNIHMSQE